VGKVCDTILKFLRGQSMQSTKLIDDLKLNITMLVKQGHV